MTSKRFKKLPEKTRDLTVELIEKLLIDVKKNCTTKFDESIDLSFQINNKQKKGEVNIRTIVNLPGGTGKKVKVAVVCEDAKSQEAKDAGADIVGSEELIEKIKSGELNFEKLISTPGMMVKLSKLGKVLGPKGLMPNPKVGTVSPDVAAAVKNAKAGQVRFRADKNGIVHGGIGVVSFDASALKQNLEALMVDLAKAKPASAKGIYVKKVTISSTMGPGLLVDQASLTF
jgi:large subunit ribosomal protein L1